MSTTRWYFRSSGKTSGPYTSTQLKQLAENGHIAPNTEVRRETDEVWVTASKVRGLFNSKQSTDISTTIQSASTNESSRPKIKNSRTIPTVLVTIGVVIVGFGVGLFLLFSGGKQNTDLEIAIRNAKLAIDDGKFSEAEAIIHSMSQSDAKDKNKILELTSVIARKRVEQEQLELKNAVDENLLRNDFETAKKSLQSIIGKTSSQETRLIAENTLQDIERASSEDYAKKIIENLTDQGLADLLSTQALPSELTLTNPTVQSLFLKKCLEIASIVDKARKQLTIEENERKRTMPNGRETGKELARIDINGLEGFELSADRRILAACDPGKKEICIWSINDLPKKKILKLPANTRFPMGRTAVALSTDLKTVVSTIDIIDPSGIETGIGEISKETTLGCWDLSTGSFRGFFENPNPSGFYLRGRVVATNMFALCIADNNDKNGGGDYPLVQIWRLSDGKCHGSFRGHSKTIQCIAVLPDSNRAITGGDDRIVSLWDIETGQEIRVFDKHQSSVLSVAVSPDERSLISGGFDCSVIHWDLQTGNVKSTWQLGDYDALKENSWRLNLLSWGTKIRLGQKTTGMPPAWLLPTVVRVDFSPRGNEILACLSVKDPRNLKNPSNPVLINLEDGSIVGMASEFNKLPLHESWAAFNHESTAIIFNRRRTERLRGQEKSIDYLSFFGFP